MTSQPRVRYGLGSRVVVAGLIGSLLALGQVGLVSAAQTWTVTADRLNLPLGSDATVTLTIRNTSSDHGGGSGIGCVEVAIPSPIFPSSAFAITAADVVSVSHGLSWGAQTSVSLPRGVVATGDDNGERLLGSPNDDVLRLGVTVTAKTLGVYTWTVTAFHDSDCNGGFPPAKTLVFTVIGPPSTPKPTPTPTPEPTPTRSPTPTATPTRSPSPTPGGTPVPTNPGATPDPTPTPTERPPGGPTPTPSPTAAATVRPEPSPTPDPTQSETAATGSTGSGGPGSSAPPGSGSGSLGKIETWSPSRSSDGGLSIGGFAGIDLSEWAVPGALLTGPGLLLLVLIAAQATGALAWLPVVRRKVGAFGPGGRRRAVRSA